MAENEGTAEAVVYKGVYPIGDTKTDALPVENMATGLDFYTQVLGFSVVSSNDHTAVLQRDDATIGLAVNGEDPEQASCYVAVSNVEAARNELAAKGLDLSETRIDEHGGSRYRVFFAREPYGVCFCFGEQV